MCPKNPTWSDLSIFDRITGKIWMYDFTLESKIRTWENWMKRTARERWWLQGTSHEEFSQHFFTIQKITFFRHWNINTIRRNWMKRTTRNTMKTNCPSQTPCMKHLCNRQNSHYRKMKYYHDARHLKENKKKIVMRTIRHFK